MRITLLTAANCTPDRGSVADIDSGAFLDWLGNPVKCPSVECADDAAKMAGAGFVFAQYVDGAKAKSNANLSPDSCTDLLCYDVDEATLAEVVNAGPVWRQVDAVVYSTWKHTPTDPRIRFIVRLTRPIGNATEADFRKIYTTAAYLLQVPADPRASNRANFYFGPQHKPGRAGDCERYRFRGEALDVDALLEVYESGAVPAAVTRDTVDFEGVRAKPDKAAVKAITKRLAAGGEREQWIGAALDAVLRGDSFASEGNAHNTQLQIAFEVVRAVPLVDAEWFADTYLAPAWSTMNRWGDLSVPRDNWIKAVTSAQTKLAADRENRAATAAQYTPGIAAELDADALQRAANAAGGLVCEHRGAFYVFDPRLGVYVGPLKGTGLAAACRRCLVGVPGFSYQSFRQNAPPVLKSGPKLVEEYGVDLESVHYHALPPDVAFDRERRSIRLPAYQWNEWAAIWHPIADELLRAMSGLQYARVEAWLSRVRDLAQPLPALTLIGNRGTWKSRTAQTLSRFWGPATDPTPCDASQVLNRFSGPLLSNPVIWSDEGLARSDTGRAIPEAYRRSITECAHMVERKGIDPVTLHTATRHVISVNDVDKVFGGEVDAASVEATIERYLVVQIDSAAIDAFELRWSGSRELGRLRAGDSLLEHIKWLEENTQHASAGRLFVATDTNPELLLRARFADDTLSLCVGIAVEALLSETRVTVPGQVARLPLVCDEMGRLRLSPGRIVDLWSESRLTVGSMIRKPTQQRVGRMLQKAGFKVSAAERAVDSRRWKAWAVEHGRFREYLHVEGAVSWDEIKAACLRVFNREPNDK